MKKHRTLLKKLLCISLLLCFGLSAFPISVSATGTTTSSFPPANPEQSPLYGKSVVFIGDSICYAGNDNHKGYGGRIGEAYSMTWYNRGISGAGVYNGRKFGQIANQLWVDASKDVDYVIMQGMINDAINAAPMGAITSGFDPEQFDNSTFAGGLENMFYTARKYYPEATYGFIITYKCPYKPGRTDGMTRYVKMVKQACEKYKIPYIDLCNDEDFCNNVLKVDTTEYLTDKLHPNSAGHTLLAQKLAPWMESLTHQPLSGIADRTADPLYGKSALFVGDSILQADADRACDADWRIYPSGQRSWAGRIGLRNNMTFTNAGKSGATIAETSSNNQIYTQLHKNKRHSFDFVILWGGINDAWKDVPIGSLSNSTNIDDFDQTTFYGGLEATLCSAKEWYADSTIAYVISYSMPLAKDGVVLTTLRNGYGAYVDAIKAACEKWGVPYLNLYEDTDFCTNVLKTGTSNYYFKDDGIHPYTPGHDLLALRIEPYIEQLALANDGDDDNNGNNGSQTPPENEGGNDNGGNNGSQTPPENEGGDDNGGNSGSQTPPTSGDGNNTGDGNGSSQTPPTSGDGNSSGNDSAQTPTNPPADHTDPTPDDTPETTTAAPADTTAADEKSSGCNASLSAMTGVLATTALAGAAISLPRKKKKK